MKRSRSLLLAGLAVAAVVAVLGAPAAGSVVSVDVTADPDPAPPGSNVTTSATVSNLGPDDSSVTVQRVELRTTADGSGELLRQRVVSDSLGAGQSTTVELSEEFDDSGEYRRYVHVRIREGVDDPVTVVRPVNVTVGQTHPAMSLSTAPPSGGGDADIGLTVANGLPSTVRGVEVDLASGNASLAQPTHVVSSIPSGEAATVRTTASDVEGDEVTVDATLSYVTAEGASRTVTRTLSAARDAGSGSEVLLTGTRVTRNGDVLVIRGSASNVGTANASSVLVRAADGAAVGPAQDMADYFVGRVAPSDYASFEVRSRLSGDANGTVTVPVEVAYDAGGERVTRTVELDYVANESDGAEPSRESSTSVVPAVVGGLVLLLAVGLGYRRFGE